MFCTLPVSAKKWVGVGEGTGAKKNRNDNNLEEGDGEKGGVRVMWKNLGPTFRISQVK